MLQRGTLLAAAALLAGSACRPRSFNAEPQEAKATGEQLWNDTQAKLFQEKFVHQIYIKLNQAAWNQLHDDEKNNGCSKGDDVKWVYLKHLAVDGQDFPHAAFKVRGNTSRCIPRLQFSVRLHKAKGVWNKQSWDREWHKVDFNEADAKAIKKQNLYGLPGFSLRRSFNDASASNDSGQGMLAREYVGSWAVAQGEKVSRTTVRGAATYRTSYAVVEFQLCNDDADEACNNRFRRMYILSENIDSDYFRIRYDDDAPTAFSMTYGHALKLDENGNHEFRTKYIEPLFIDGNEVEDENSPEGKALLAKAADLFDGPNGLVTRLKAAKTKADVEAVLDLQNFYNYAASATTIGHWDSAYGNFNNDVLYFHKASGKWKIITWDVDNTFDFDGPGNPGRDYKYQGDLSKSYNRRIIFDTLFGIPEIEKEFKEHLKKYLAVLYTSRDSGPLHDKIYSAQQDHIRKVNEEYGLPAGERQDLSRIQEMNDYKVQRYLKLQEQLGQ